MITIYQKQLKLIKNIVVIVAVLPMIAWADVTYKMSNPSAEQVTVRLALTKHESSKGLSGIKAADFPLDQGMLFVNESMGARRFWMPDTYFNLDIIFLDAELKIIGMEKNAPFHPGFIEPPVIYRTSTYQAQFILETKAGAPFSKKLKVGDKLKWISATALSEIVLKTRQQQ